VVVGEALTAGTLRLEGVRVGNFQVTDFLVDGGYVDDAGMALLPDQSTKEYLQGVSGPLFQNGDSLRVRASGSGFPEFVTPPLVVPRALVVTAPSCSNSGCGLHPRDLPLSVSWNGIDSGVFVTIGARPADRVGFERTELRCVFSGLTGSGTVPQTAMEFLPDVGADGGRAFVKVYTSARLSVDGGSYLLDFEVDFSGASGEFATY
jgi:hypothetical protein